MTEDVLAEQADDDPAATLLERICAASVRVLPVDGAAVSAMSRAGHQGAMCATDATVAALEETQFALGEGPGVEAFRTGKLLLVPDLADRNDGASRWPSYASAALDLDVRAVFAFPLILGAAEFGILLMYAREPTVLDAGSRSTAIRLADAAALALLDEMDGRARASRRIEDGGDVLAIDADFYRSEVYQAAGMTMVQLGVGIETALARIRGHAYAQDLPIHVVARAIVARDLRLESDG